MFASMYLSFMMKSSNMTGTWLLNALETTGVDSPGMIVLINYGCLPPSLCMVEKSPMKTFYFSLSTISVSFDILFSTTKLSWT